MWQQSHWLAIISTYLQIEQEIISLEPYYITQTSNKSTLQSLTIAIVYLLRKIFKFKKNKI